MLASECWFLFVALDLAIAVTDPFASQKSRLRWYHLFCWSIAALSGLVVGLDHEVNGTWYISENVNSDNGGGICWIQTHMEGGENIDYKPWVLYLLPLMIIYIVPLRSLLSAYRKVRMGLSKTFEHRGRMFLSSAINVVMYYVYLMVVFMLYMGSTWFYVENPGVSSACFKLLIFVLASRGYVNLMVFYVVDANDVDGANEEKTIDVNFALKEELLYFATIGISECVRRSSGYSMGREKCKLLLFEDADDSVPSISADSRSIPIANKFSASSFLTAIFGADTSRMSEMLYRAPSLKSITSIEVADPSIGSGSVQEASNPSRHMRRSAEASFDPDHDDHVDTELGALRREQEAAASSVASANTSGEYKSSHSHLFIPTINAMHKDKKQGQSSSADGIEIRVTEMSARDSSGVNRSSAAAYSLSSTAAYVRFPLLSCAYRWCFCIEEGPKEGPFCVEFTEFKPYYFRQIRLCAGISDDAFIEAFKHTVKERLTEGGASGSFFFYSQGEKFVAKSLRRQDLDNLLGCVVPYSTHLLNNKNSLITKIYGAYNLQMYGNNLTFVVMSNVLLTKGELINERYDIKGSWVNRNAEVPRDGQLVTCRYCNKAYIYRRHELAGRKNSNSSTLGWNSSDGGTAASSNNNGSRRDGLISTAGASAGSSNGDTKCPYAVFGMHKPNVTLKDNDLKSRMLLSSTESRRLLDQLKKDAEFLCQQDFMDYSLLIGVHNTEYQVEVPRGSCPIPAKNDAISAMGASPHRTTAVRASTTRDAAITVDMAAGVTTANDNSNSSEDDSLLSTRYQATRVVGAESYYFGIIDFQQKWDYSKSLERAAKMLMEPDRNGISAMEPRAYRDRFMRTLEELFAVDEDSDDLDDL